MYDERDGVLPISWNEFHGICKSLAVAVAHYEPQLILPVGRGGNYAGTLLAHMLRLELHPIRLTRREDDEVVRERPLWRVRPPDTVRGLRVLVVDEISASGETIRIVNDAVMEMGAADSRSAVLYAHSPGVDAADYVGIISDALILNPWDREILAEGEFRFHPEYLGALEKQGLPPDDSFRIEAPHFRLAKER